MSDPKNIANLTKSQAELGKLKKTVDMTGVVDKALSKTGSSIGSSPTAVGAALGGVTGAAVGHAATRDDRADECDISEDDMMEADEFFGEPSDVSEDDKFLQEDFFKEAGCDSEEDIDEKEDEMSPAAEFYSEGEEESSSYAEFFGNDVEDTDSEDAETASSEDSEAVDETTIPANEFFEEAEAAKNGMVSAKAFFAKDIVDEAEEDIAEDDLLKDRVHNGHKPVNEDECDEAIKDEDFFMPVDETEKEDSEGDGEED